MRKRYLQEIALLSMLVVGLPFSAPAGEADLTSGFPAKKNLTDLQKQARIYRNQGFELQNTGIAENIAGAVTFYQKAIQLDPRYAVPYNDMGVIYEAGGLFDEAEKSYLTAARIDPDYLSPYSNLAALYENQGETEKAFEYWKLRANNGSPKDTWTQKARAKVDELIKQIPSQRQQFIRQQTIELSREIAEQKKIKRLGAI